MNWAVVQVLLAAFNAASFFDDPTRWWAGALMVGCGLLAVVLAIDDAGRS